MYNNEVILPHWMEQFLKVANVIGTDNVFLSIFENGSISSRFPFSFSFSLYYQTAKTQLGSC